MQAVLEAHDAQAHRAVLEVGVARLADRVVVDVDDVVEHAHRGADRALELVVVEHPGAVGVARSRCATRLTDPRLQTAISVSLGVQRDLGAQVRAVDDAHVLLRRAQVAGILERDPGMAGLEQHREHLAPQLHRRDLLAQLQLAAGRLRS